jgi:DMSO reductase anchor subunit
VIIPAQTITLEEQMKQNFTKEPAPKINLKDEWPLVLFTLTAPVLTGWLLATLMTNVNIWPVFYLGLGLIALLLSGIHLGKKGRAFRASINLKKSWLSQEVFFYALFLGASLLYFLTGFVPWIGWITSFLGLITLVSIDRVYSMTRVPVPSYLHSAGVLLTGILMYALISGEIILTGILLGIKLLLYIYRKITVFRNKGSIRPWLTISRIILGFILPFLIWFHILPFAAYSLFILILIAELIDRVEFYLVAEIMSPSVFVSGAEK